MRHALKSPPARVALLLERQLGYCREVLAGIQRFALQRPGWIFHEGQPDARILPHLAKWKPQGVVGHVYTRELHDGLTALKMPLVLTTRTLPGISTPDVDVDHGAVGRMAAEYFLGKGFLHFGYFGSGRARFSMEREAGFRRMLRRRGLEVSACHVEYLPMPPFDLDWRLLDTTIGRWLQQRPKPFALLASNDLTARLVCNECQRLGIAVPGEVAILGVDNDEYECGLARPPLSSIALPAEEIGFAAVAMLDQLMRGKRPRHLHPAPPPLHVVSRQSTDHFAVADPVAQRALQFIKDQGTRPLRVEEVRRHCAVSRRILERRFQSELHRSPLQAIHRACVERAKPLLQGTRLGLDTVAARSGFSSARQMADIFRKATGSSPSGYRRRGSAG